MRAFSQSPVLRRRSASSNFDPVIGGRQPLSAPGRVRFVPAGWLVAVLAILRLTLGGRRIATLGLVGLLWSLAPQGLKLALAGLGVASVIVLAGALAALALLVIQLS